MIDYLKSKYIYFLGVNLINALVFIFLLFLNLDIIYFLLIFFTANIVLLTAFLIEGYQISKYTNTIDSLLNEIEEIQLVASTLESAPTFETNLLNEYLELYSKKFYNLHHQAVVENKMYEDFIVLIIHDIKIEIQNIKLKHNDIDTKPLEDLVQKILVSSKVSNLDYQNQLSKVNIKQIVSNILNEYFELCYQKKIKVTLDFKTDFLICDQYWIEFALRQLIDNAIKYTDNTLSITVTDNDITVTSNGQLISEHDLPRITTRGYIGSNSNSSHKSSGFGLYLTKQICDSFGYKLKITNNQNNTFQIIIKSD